MGQNVKLLNVKLVVQVVTTRRKRVVTIFIYIYIHVYVYTHIYTRA